MVPMTCPTCGFLLGDKQIPYDRHMDKVTADLGSLKGGGVNGAKLEEREVMEKINAERLAIMTKLGIFDYCCRMRMMTAIRNEHIYKNYA
jgi:DNA-directed RNA polymerase subunit N (RpoN/RPB10)